MQPPLKALGKCPGVYRCLLEEQQCHDVSLLQVIRLVVWLFLERRHDVWQVEVMGSQSVGIVYVSHVSSCCCFLLLYL